MACSGGGGVAAEYVGTLLGLAPALPCGRVGERFHKRRFKSRAPPCRVTRRKKERERERVIYRESREAEEGAFQGGEVWQVHIARKL